jgi:hypothetical protein
MSAKGQYLPRRPQGRGNRKTSDNARRRPSAQPLAQNNAPWRRRAGGFCDNLPPGFVIIPTVDVSQMSSLANLPELVGFFSYSREDDDSFKGTLSALRDAIQRELSAQLGRSKKTFRLWQDQESIAPGQFWASEIKNAVEQAAFFIPIITPRMVNSHNCHFEFEAFVARERALGRSDLVFPILYISVPALENEAQWRDHPVLSFVGQRQWVDWRPFRHQDVHTTAVREAIERFCGKIVEALNVSWMSPEERKRQEEVDAQHRTENERQQQDAETRRLAEEEERHEKDAIEAQRIAEECRRQEADAERQAHEEKVRKNAEAEAQQRAEQERLGREAETKQRAEQEQTYAAAKLEDTVSAVDKFLGAYPESHLTGEAKTLRATLIARDEAYGGAMSSADPTVLKAFLDRYPAGGPADQVRSRLRSLEPRQSSPLSRRAMVIGGSVVGAGALATLTAIISHRPGSSDTTAPTTQSATPTHPIVLATFTGHTDIVNSVAISPDGNTALSGSDDKTLRVWLYPDSPEVRQLSGHTHGVNSVVFAQDG